jgi:hypothetical protein
MHEIITIYFIETVFLVSQLIKLSNNIHTLTNVYKISIKLSSINN